MTDEADEVVDWEDANAEEESVLGKTADNRAAASGEIADQAAASGEIADQAALASLPASTTTDNRSELTAERAEARGSLGGTVESRAEVGRNSVGGSPEERAGDIVDALATGLKNKSTDGPPAVWRALRLIDGEECWVKVQEVFRSRCADIEDGELRTALQRWAQGTEEPEKAKLMLGDAMSEGDGKESAWNPAALRRLSSTGDLSEVQGKRHSFSGGTKAEGESDAAAIAAEALGQFDEGTETHDDEKRGVDEIAAAEARAEGRLMLAPVGLRLLLRVAPSLVGVSVLFGCCIARGAVIHLQRVGRGRLARGKLRPAVPATRSKSLTTASTPDAGPWQGITKTSPSFRAKSKSVFVKGPAVKPGGPKRPSIFRGAIQRVQHHIRTEAVPLADITWDPPNASTDAPELHEILKQAKQGYETVSEARRRKWEEQAGRTKSVTPVPTVAAEPPQPRRRPRRPRRARVQRTPSSSNRKRKRSDRLPPIPPPGFRLPDDRRHLVEYGNQMGMRQLTAPDLHDFLAEASAPAPARQRLGQAKSKYRARQPGRL
eukprot:Hpha_TRINITY_DN16843_c1_g4::TRINITY_DN16843_c1_g4_i1::g.152240::m.152240